MRYDLQLVHDYCRELGLSSRFRSPDEVVVDLGEGAVLRFLNAEQEQDCLMEFDGTPWHTHGDFIFADRHGSYVEMTYLDVIEGIADGRILICERWIEGDMEDRWLVHRDYIDEFRFMEEGEEVRIWRYLPPPSA